MADLGLAAKVRPALILSVSFEGHERAIVSYVIRTTSLRATQYEVPHETRGMPKGAFDAQGLGSMRVPRGSSRRTPARCFCQKHKRSLLKQNAKKTAHYGNRDDGNA
jgi:hypothetical protein